MTVPPPDPRFPAGPNQPPAGLDGAPSGQPGAWGQPTQVGAWNRPQPGGWPQPGGHPFGAPGPAGYPPPYPAPGQPTRGTNGFAIASLVLGIIGVVLLSVIFGFVALAQIKKNGQGGRGLAIAGLVLSGFWLLVIAVLIVVGITTSADRDGSGQITGGGTVSATSLEVGDCVNDLKTSTMLATLPAVPCSQVHEGEVFAAFDLTAGPYPGDAAVQNAAAAGCSVRLGAYSPSAADDQDTGLYFLYPKQQNWRSDDREVTCIATPPSGTSTGSIRGR